MTPCWLARSRCFSARLFRSTGVVKPPKNLPDAIDIWVRGLGSCAFLMLTVILCIGPLARLNTRFLPLLYNRRHFGVLTFLIALVHAWMMIEWYLAQDSLPSLWRELTKWSDYFRFLGFPFKILGLGALVIMFLMAATSHDFWLDFLTPAIWKALHMAVYAAYGLAVMHVSVGVLQYEYSPLLPAMLISSLVLVCGLHLAAGWREHALDRGMRPGTAMAGSPLVRRTPFQTRPRASSRRRAASASPCSATANRSAR